MHFNYLGSEITSGCTLAEEEKSEIYKAGEVAGCLTDILIRNKYVSTDNKVRIYKTVAHPVMTYTVKTRKDSKKTIQNIHTRGENLKNNS